MKIKKFLLHILIFYGTACQSDIKNNTFNESDYTILLYDSVFRKVYVDKKDKRRKIVYNFWVNGDTLSKQFFNGFTPHGPCWVYSVEKKLIYKGCFIEGLKSDSQYYYNEAGLIERIEFFVNGEKQSIRIY